MWESQNKSCKWRCWRYHKGSLKNERIWVQQFNSGLITTLSPASWIYGHLGVIWSISFYPKKEDFPIISLLMTRVNTKDPAPASPNWPSVESVAISRDHSGRMSQSAFITQNNNHVYLKAIYKVICISMHLLWPLQLKWLNLDWASAINVTNLKRPLCCLA